MLSLVVRKETARLSVVNAWRRALEKLTSSQLIKKLPAFYGT